MWTDKFQLLQVSVEVGINDGFVLGKYIPGDSITLNIHKTLLSI